jgi:ABC-type transport system substrate-binding protein
VFDGKIVGLNEWHDLAVKSGTTDYSAPIEGLKSLDRYTLQVKLKQKSGLFLYVLAMPFTGIVPREAVEAYGKEFINHAVGTGPFRRVQS